MIRILLFLLLFVSSAQAQSVNGLTAPTVNGLSYATVNGISLGCSDTCTGSFYCQDCEGTGTPSGWTDETNSGNGGTVSWDNTTTPLMGTQDLSIYAGTTGTADSYYAFTAASEVWVHVRVKFASVSPSSSLAFLALKSTASTKYTLSLNTANKLVGSHNNVYPTTTGTYSTTMFHIWWRCKASTDTNGIMDIYTSANGTKPESPTVSTAVGTQTSTVNRLYLQSNLANTIQYDQIIITTDGTAIGNVCD